MPNRPKSTMETLPMRMTVGYAIRAALILGNWDSPDMPTAKQLVALTARLPDLFPRPWTLEEAAAALANPNSLIGRDHAQ